MDTLLSTYYALFRHAPNLMELLRKKDKAALGKLGRKVLDASAPDDWCWWTIVRLSQEWSEIRIRHRGLHTAIRKGLVQPPVNPAPDVVLGLLLNDQPPKKTEAQVAEAAVSGLMKRLAAKGG